ncbi:MAG: acyl-CoA carboxylase subunit epsilon [Actinomycetota bacterium]|nr:acyl-CoA carboxylase subunit epsilon [Actinomycetota bacterium]
MATSRSEPSPEELAAIVAAVAALWAQRPMAPAEPVPRARPPAWRFSGRWWAPGTAASRRR